MPVAVIADAHLGGPGGSGEDLAEQLGALESGRCARVLFLGDLFHLWIGSRRFETPEIRRLAAAIRGLRRRGIRVSYVEGNRDFFLADGAYGDLFDDCGREVGFDAEGVKYLAIHGDGLNPRDWRYRCWRRLSKNAASRWLTFRLPRAVGRRIVASTERGLARTNLEHKAAIPGAVIRRYAERRLAEGNDVLLLGHFHAARRWNVGDGEVRIADAWFHDRKLLWLG